MASRANAERYVLRCHALVWHSQLAPWVTATNWTKDELKTIIHDHITNVMGHWKGRCYAWDVVNEALNEDGTYRSSVFYDTLGEDFIKYAFQVAHETDPNAKLYYNDYNLEYPGAKVSGAARIVSMLQNAGIHIDGVGLQSHLTAEGHPTIDQHIDAISTFTRLGVEVALTELDVRLTLPATPALLAKQSQGYKNVCFNLQRTHLPAVGHQLTCLIRSSEPALKSRDASASRFGIFTILLAGCLLPSPAKVCRCCGMPTSPSIRPTMVSLRLSRTPPAPAAKRTRGLSLFLIK